MAHEEGEDDMNKYKRVVLKISGECLGCENGTGFDFKKIEAVADRLLNVKKKCGIELSIVVGGGNLFRARYIQGTKVNRTVADYIGMLGTVMNGLALSEAMERLGAEVRVMTAFSVPAVAESFIWKRAIRHLEKGRVVIFCGGTGSPFFTTDSAAALRATEIKAEVILKAANVNGVYDSDPHKNPQAKLYTQLTYQECLEKHLQIMDSTAFALCQDNKIPIIVFNFDDPGVIEKILRGEKIGTLVN